ncbi:hypothetical protein [Spirochaeta thermophila]|uniref:Uncharacterized protein n=1 Tax=Winmispira thermophila (strain ATCC 49972 / DSM 6192 / RI 19.B1) TaxID=665571 RepID=E0RTZ0_WINT6|nr:hypothetical protein [Spirochaeta thermophila]ADN01046.1 hypothetical protein STHERM_c00700 [Spirochaeta thermophila DSM 6192]
MRWEGSSIRERAEFLVTYAEDKFHFLEERSFEVKTYRFGLEYAHPLCVFKVHPISYATLIELIWYSSIDEKSRIYMLPLLEYIIYKKTGRKTQLFMPKAKLFSPIDVDMKDCIDKIDISAEYSEKYFEDIMDFFQKHDEERVGFERFLDERRKERRGE